MLCTRTSEANGAFDMEKTEYVAKMLRDGKLVEYQPKEFIDGVLTDKDIEMHVEQEPVLNVEVGAYTTWFDDPSTSVMLHYQTIDNTPVECLYRKEGDTDWLDVPLFSDEPYPLSSKRVRWFKLEGLESGTVYETKLKYHEQTHRFKTLPSAASDVKIALLSDQLNSRGGFNADAPIGFNTLKNNNLDAIVIAGDCVHDNSTGLEYWELFWGRFFDYQKSNNLMVPIIVCIGNHDGAVHNPDNTTSRLWVNTGATEDDVTFLYHFFSNLNADGYGTVDVSDYLSYVFLNSYHTRPIVGTQTTWLASVLSEREGRHIFPFFHTPPYPAWYSLSTPYAKGTRDNWTPLFTQHGVKIVGNGHEHAHVVTKKVTGDSLDPNGVVYTGQGHGMGNNTRGVNIDESTWYVDFVSAEEKGFDLIEFRQNGDVHLNKVNLQGDTLYSITL